MGATNASALAGVVRYGEATVDGGGLCGVVSYSNEEQIYVGRAWSDTQAEAYLLRKRISSICLRPFRTAWRTMAVRHFR